MTYYRLAYHTCEHLCDSQACNYNFSKAQKMKYILFMVYLPPLCSY